MQKALQGGVPWWALGSKGTGSDLCFRKVTWLQRDRGTKGVCGKAVAVVLGSGDEGQNKKECLGGNGYRGRRRGQSR